MTGRMNDDEILAKLIETEERSKSNTHRLNNIEQEHGELNKNLNRMATAVEVLATEQKHSTEEQRKMRETMSETNERVANLEIAPARDAKKVRDEIVRQIVGVLAGAIVGAVAALILR